MGSEMCIRDRSKGDSQLTEWMQNYVNQGSVLAMFDAPLICRNKTGSRPVDRASHRLFGKYKAGCYPVNQQLCKRPLKISDQLKRNGFRSIGESLSQENVT